MTKYQIYSKSSNGIISHCNTFSDIETAMMRIRLLLLENEYDGTIIVTPLPQQTESVISPLQAKCLQTTLLAGLLDRMISK